MVPSWSPYFSRSAAASSERPESIESVGGDASAILDLMSAQSRHHAAQQTLRGDTLFLLC